MTQSPDSFLDANDLFHLALHAGRQGKNEEAITTLKRALVLAPEDARLHYALSMQYNHIGFLERAVAHLQQTLVLNPGADHARFQLGWLLLNGAREDLATDAWKPLDKLGETHPLCLFKTGLLHLARNQLAECEKQLSLGIAANKVEPALNHDIAVILRNVQSRLARESSSTTDAPTANEPAPAAKSPTPATSRLGAYKQHRSE
jgi:tetratricopeptide (TPR) repeat protein